MMDLWCAAVVKTEAGPQSGKLYTEEDWNTESKPDKDGGYRYSKVSFCPMSSLRSASPTVIAQACSKDTPEEHEQQQSGAQKVPDTIKTSVYGLSGRNVVRHMPDGCNALCRLKQRRQGGNSARRKGSPWSASTPRLCWDPLCRSVSMPHPSCTSRCVLKI